MDTVLIIKDGPFAKEMTLALVRLISGALQAAAGLLAVHEKKTFEPSRTAISWILMVGPAQTQAVFDGERRTHVPGVCIYENTVMWHVSPQHSPCFFRLTYIDIE
jgi:hypothetical protein